MCIRDRGKASRTLISYVRDRPGHDRRYAIDAAKINTELGYVPVSYTHLRAHETVLDLVCRLLLEKKNQSTLSTTKHYTMNNI